MATQPPMREWLTGVPGPVPAYAAVRTVVVEDADLVPDLLAGGLLDAESRLIVRSVDGPPVSAPSIVASYRGTFAATDSMLEFDNGYQLNSRHYGAAEFLCYDTPTILRVNDADDFSAYLRDADRAWPTGRFPNHLTHPNVVVADLAALGGPARASGPDRRLFVFADATVSTSPTGAVLGDSTDHITAIDDRWHAVNDSSAYPDAVALDRVVGDRDRSAALLERPWMQRYLLACSVISLVRAEHRQPARASGFGGRITTGLPDVAAADPIDAPVLLQIGRAYQAHDPSTGVALAISAVSLAIVESLLAHSHVDDAAGWIAGHVGVAPRQVPDHLLGTLRLLADAGVAPGWCHRAAGNRGVDATW